MTDSNRVLNNRSRQPDAPSLSDLRSGFFFPLLLSCSFPAVVSRAGWNSGMVPEQKRTLLETTEAVMSEFSVFSVWEESQNWMIM